MKTCSKKYQDIPFAHRAHNDQGHCAYIHGHSWAFEFDWAGEPDARGFILDFGALGWLKEFIAQTFDHACVLNEADEEGARMVREFPRLFRAVYIRSCSAEGIAEFLFYSVVEMMRQHNIQAELLRVTVFEDSKNKAAFVNDDARAWE